MGNNRFIVLVLGMHRSGTSCLAGCLERSGVALGDVSRKGRYNQKGNYELSEVQRLNDQILNLNRGSWNQPPKHIKIHPYHLNRMTEIGERLFLNSPSGIKDPRLLLIDEWKRVLPLPIKFIGTFRHPEAVARSLKFRNGIPHEKGIALWKYYNELLIETHKNSSFPIIEFNLSDVNTYCDTVVQVSERMGLSAKTEHIRYFVSSDLDHNHSDDLIVPESCREVYAYLRENRFDCCRKLKTLPNASTKKQKAISHAMGAVQEFIFNASRIITDRSHKSRKAI